MIPWTGGPALRGKPWSEPYARVDVEQYMHNVDPSGARPPHLLMPLSFNVIEGRGACMTYIQ